MRCFSPLFMRFVSPLFFVLFICGVLYFVERFILSIFIPSFEMTVTAEQAQVVKQYDGLDFLRLSVLSSFEICNERYQTFAYLVVSSDSRGYFSDLGDRVHYECANSFLRNCPEMVVEYVDEETVYVTDIFAARMSYSLSYIQECATNVIDLGRSLTPYVDEGSFNVSTYDDL